MTNPNPDPLVGRTVGQYQILARIGGGGMGVVYTARDARLSRTVALKFLPPQWSHDETAKERFVREAQAASATNHPNICTIHDIETADDGQLFIVMAYYEGQTLKTRLESGRLPIEEALDIGTQVADGLARAHAQGVVHRDIKPGNLILTEDGVRILDFGLATFADALKLTMENAPLGTVAYMSPEQVRGQQADARADVWATGAVLYEMLTGHPPFAGSHMEAVSYAIRNESPQAIRAERPDIPEEVEQLVFRALHKEPSVRYASGRELARALRQVRGLSVPLDLRTQPVPPPDRAVRPRLPRLPRLPVKSKWWIAAAIVVVAASMTTWVLWPAPRTTIAVAPFGNQTGDPDLEQYRLALAQSLAVSLSDSPDLNVVSYSRVLESLRRFVHDGTDISSRDAIQAITSHTATSLVIVPTIVREGVAWRGRVELRDSRTASNLWEHETDPVTSSLTHDTVHELSSAIARAVERHLGTSRTRFVETLRALWPGVQRDGSLRPRSLEAVQAFAEGTAWYDDLEYARAQEAFKIAVERDPRNPLLLAWLSRAAQITRDEKTAVDAADQALSAVTNRTPRVAALFVEAIANEARRDLAAAERAYRALLAIRPDDPTWTSELAAFLDRQARNQEAVAAYHAALTADPRVLRPRLELCRLYSPSRLNEPVESSKYGKAAFDAYHALGAAGGEGQSLLCLADTSAVGNETDRTRAWSYAEQARQLFVDMQYGYNEARAEYYLALVAGMQGRFGDSINLGEHALKRARESGNNLVQPIVMNNLGIAHVARGDRQTAADYYQQAYTLYQSWHDEARASRIQANRGAMLIEYGNPAEGILDVRNALSVAERLKDKNFETFCLRVIATYYRNQGRHDDALRELNKALAIARERNLADNVTVMTTFVGLSQFEIGDYDAARRSFLDALKDGTGRRSIEARIRAARAYVRLGDLTSADTALDAAERELRSAPNRPLQALLSLVRGERAFESRQIGEARKQVEQASSLWGDTVPEPAAVEARGYAGLFDAAAGHPDAGRTRVRQAIDAARKLGQLSLEVRCLALVAEIELGQKRLGEALRWLDAVPEDDNGRTVGPELRARVLWLRGKIRSLHGEAGGAATDATAARALIRGIIEHLPETYRTSYSRRETVRQIAD